MVSLSRGTNSLVGDGSEISEPNVQSLLQPVVGQENLKKFTPLNTVIPAAFLLILSVVMQLLVLSLTFFSNEKEDKKCDPYFRTLYAHLVYWSFNFVLHFYFKRKHHESRLRGYLEFYLKTNFLSGIPFYITSIWNTLLLLVATVFHELYNDLESRCDYQGGFLTPMNYMCFIITLENLFIVPTLVSYIYKVVKFNKSRLCPDVQKDEWMASFVQDCYSAGEVGYREQDNHIEDLLEKQADLLRYLKEQNSRLAQKVLVLNNLLKSQNESFQC